MKELSIEEKAKRYEEAIEKAKEYFNSPRTCFDIEQLCNVFPELKESEDEKIRNQIIEHIKWSKDVGNCASEESQRWIAWLERQGEQREIDYNEELKKCKANPLYFFDKYVRVKLKEQKSADKVEPKFKIGQTIKKEGFNLGFTIVKIEDGFYYNDMGDYFPFIDQDNWELVEQNPEWSEKDGRMLQNILDCLRNGYTKLPSDILQIESWLKSLKDRVLPQPKQEWSEEDNQYLCGLIGLIEQSKAGLPITLKGKAADNCIDWLKSLRPQNTWKPSEEQLEAINTAINVIGKGTLNGKELIGLLEQLKAL